MSGPNVDMAAQPRDPRSGIVLIAVLWAIALLSALAIAMSMTFHGFAGILSVDRDRARAEGLFGAGVEQSAGILMALGEEPLISFETDITLSTGSLHLRLSDEAGRIDVNKAPVAVLTSLLRAVGASDAEQITKSIDAWRRQDKADQPGAAAQNQFQTLPQNPPLANATPPQGTPTSGQSAPQGPADGFQSFTDIRQLAQIPGMTPEYVAALAPLTTVFGDERVNALSASAKVIAVLPEVGPERVDTFLAARQGTVTESRMEQALGPAFGYVKLQGRPVALAEMTVRLADGYAAAADAVIVVVPGDNQPYRVLAWTPVPVRRNIDANGDYRRDDAY